MQTGGGLSEKHKVKLGRMEQEGTGSRKRGEPMFLDSRAQLPGGDSNGQPRLTIAALEGYSREKTNDKDLILYS